MLSVPMPRLLSGAFALMLATSVHADHIKVILLGGQSNMQGNNALLSQLGQAMVELLTTTPPDGSFTDWISGSDVDGQTGFDQDPDGDGIKNGVENYFGTHPGEFSQGLVSATVAGNSFTFTHPLNDSPASDLTAGYRWSKDLASFHADGGTHEVTTVSFSQGTPSGGMVTVTTSITGTPIDRLFVDLEVTQD